MERLHKYISLTTVLIVSLSAITGGIGYCESNPLTNNTHEEAIDLKNNTNAQLTETQPEAFSDQIQAGIKTYRDNQLNQALNLFEDITINTQNPKKDQALAWYYMGLIALKQQNWTEASQNFQSAEVLVNAYLNDHPEAQNTHWVSQLQQFIGKGLGLITQLTQKSSLDAPSNLPEERNSWRNPLTGLVMGADNNQTQQSMLQNPWDSPYSMMMGGQNNMNVLTGMGNQGFNANMGAAMDPATASQMMMMNMMSPMFQNQAEPTNP
jgi:hypothetical protein